MKLFCCLLPAFFLCSFSGSKNGNTLDDEHLKGKVKSVTEYEFYTDKGKTKSFRKTINEYDEMGNIVVLNMYKDDSLKMGFSFDYKYDNNGNKIEENIYNQDKTQNVNTVYNYDTSGLLIGIQKHTRPDTLVIVKYAYKYDDKGRKIEEDYSNGKGIVDEKETFKYNDANTLVEKADEYLNMPVKIWYNYDNNGNEVASFLYGPFDTTHYQYYYIDFDNRDNWMQRMEVTHRFGRDDTSIYKREITYY